MVDRNLEYKFINEINQIEDNYFVLVEKLTSTKNGKVVMQRVRSCIPYGNKSIRKGKCFYSYVTYELAGCEGEIEI